MRQKFYLQIITQFIQDLPLCQCVDSFCTNKEEELNEILSKEVKMINRPQTFVR